MILDIIPIPKPRMTRNSSYRYIDYWDYKDKLKKLAHENNLVIN